MRAELRRVLGFALAFLPIFLILLGIYVKLLPAYRAVPEAVANSVMQSLAPATRIEPLPRGGWQALVRAAGAEERVFVRWQPFVVHLLFLNTLLLPALVLATPAPLRERLRLAGWAVPLLVAVQALSLIGLVRGQLCLTNSPGSFACLWLLRLVYASGQLSTAVLWSLLAWRHWLPGRTPSAAPPGAAQFR